MADEMSSNDQNKIALAREYFMRADQGRRDVLDLFHEDRRKSISQNLGLDLAGNRSSKWLKGLKGRWNTFSTTMTV